MLKERLSLGLFLFVLYYWVRILKQISKFEIVYCVENLVEMSLIYYFCIPIVNSTYMK